MAAGGAWEICGQQEGGRLAGADEFRGAGGVLKVSLSLPTGDRWFHMHCGHWSSERHWPSQGPVCVDLGGLWFSIRQQHGGMVWSAQSRAVCLAEGGLLAWFSSSPFLPWAFSLRKHS